MKTLVKLTTVALVVAVVVATTMAATVALPVTAGPIGMVMGVIGTVVVRSVLVS